MKNLKPAFMLLCLISWLTPSSATAAATEWHKIPSGSTVNAFAEKEDLQPPSILYGTPEYIIIQQFRKELANAVIPLLQDISGLGKSGRSWGIKKSEGKIIVFIFPYIDSLGPATSYTYYYLMLTLESIAESQDGKLTRDVAGAIAEHYKELLRNK